jgi:phosphoglycerate dehydrogenase-like enzyme
VGLVGRTLGSIGLGNIGAEMFRLFAPLGMRFIAHDPFVAEAEAAALGVALVELDTVFRDSDFLAVNLPLTPETTKLVDAARLATMKPSAYLINTSRGPIVDQAALVTALREGAIAGAGIDVFDPEPPSPDDPLLGLDNVIVTPHALCWTDQCFAGIGASTVAAVLDVKRGTAPDHLVERSVAEDAKFRERLESYRRAFS